MKKYSLLKIIGFMLLIFVVLSWIIPVGYYANNEFISSKTLPIGIFDLFKIPILTISNLLQYGIIIALIGGLYGVINKTGAYSKYVKNVVSKFSGKEKLFLVITISSLSLLSSLTGLQYMLLILVPFLITIIIKLGFNKIVALASTIGAILIGNIGATYSTDITYYIKETFKLNLNYEIFTRIIFLIIITFLLIMFIFKKLENKNSSKKEEKTDKKIPLYEDNDKKSNYIPLIVIFLLGLIIITINMFDWYGIFGTKTFFDLNDKVMSLSIGSYPIISNILGTITIGSWTLYDMCVFICIMSIVIGWVYSLKFEDFMNGFVGGIKEMLVPAFYAVIANIIFVALYKLQTSANIYLSITNYLLNVFENSKIILIPFVSAIGSFFYNTIGNLTNVLQAPIVYFITDTTKYSLIGLMIQFIHGIMMLFVPTSILLLVGLSYLKISYKEWFKYIWKYLLQILFVSIIIMIIVAIFV